MTISLLPSTPYFVYVHTQTVKTTLQNALKSGDRTLVDDLKESQRQTLSVMAANDKKTRYSIYVRTYMYAESTYG